MRKGRLRSSLMAVLGLIFCSHLFGASESIQFWGQVLDFQQKPLKGIKATLCFDENSSVYEFITDQNGLFRALGLSPGKYTLILSPPEYKSLNKSIHLDPEEFLFLQITLQKANQDGPSKSRAVQINFSSASQHTQISRRQIREMPSGHNIWSLIENQDLSAVTDRIDVGGLWSGIPALFSARGASSWTQNRFLFNGMDITDPFEGGTPLLYPDVFSLDRTNLTNAAHPPEFIYPGGYLDLVTGTETDDYHGSLSGYYTQHSLQGSNITESLQQEGLFENHTFDYLTEGNFRFSGPLGREKLSFFTSVTGSDLSRDVAEFDGENKTSFLSGLFSLKYNVSSKSSLHLLWTSQFLNHSSLGAAREVPFSSTNKASDRFHIIQAFWDGHINSQHHLKAGLGFVQASRETDFQDNTTLPHSQEILRNDFLRGAAPFAEKNQSQKWVFWLKGTSIFHDFLGLHHTFRYGGNGQISSSSQNIDVLDAVHLLFFKEKPLQIARYNTPTVQRQKGTDLSFFIQDTLTFSNLFSIYIGAHLSNETAWVPNFQTTNEINWLNISPRIGLIIPLSQAKTSVLKLSYARYFNTLPLKYASYGSPDSLGFLTYWWEDSNQDKLFQDYEQGDLLRRGGPFYASIDPEIKRPYADEVVISYQNNFKPEWLFFVSGFYRVYKSAVNTLNTGVPFSQYVPVYHIDSGDDRIPHNYDDLLFTVFNQTKQSLGQDFYLLSNIEKDTRATYYYGLDFSLIKRFNDAFAMFFSFTAVNAVGTTNPGNTVLENDIGVIGSLFDHPNALINTEGRPAFDRGYTARLGFKYSAPFGFLFSGIAKYYDGQPFSRKIIIEGLNQGPFYIQAHPSGKARYEFNSTLDLRVEKRFLISGSILRFILDGFNVLNLGLATEENEWTRPEFPLRYATEIQSPRVFRLGISYSF
ncbi:MAG: hypothetical protein GF421_04720 [Candidatus Aminicenantes bacterium]|nr:hypothetical protein [Candidatus Aminicenantes bacterium]